MDDSQSYTKQFKETCDMYGKGSGHNERKYYHFKLSCDPTDHPTPQQSHELAEKLAQQLFAAHECVIATHNDTDTLHSHIIVNAVSFETGKKLHMNIGEYRNCKDLADKLGIEMGFTPLDWQTKTSEKLDRIFSDDAITLDSKYLSHAERNMTKQGNLATTSWKEALRQAIDEAKAYCTNRNEFQQYLSDNYGVTMPRNTEKTVTFAHPAVGESYAVRGAKLGGDYTAASIDEQLLQNQQRSVLNARLFTETEQSAARATSTIPHSPTISSQPTSQTGNGERPATRSLSDISSELRNIDAAVGRIAKRVPLSDSADTGSDAERSVENRGNIISQPKRDESPDRGERPEPPKPVVETPKSEPTVQPKPKRRSYYRGR